MIYGKIDAAGYFEIQPETPGTLKTNGYTVRFQPDAPLKIGNTYRITLKAGLTAPNGMRLNEDYPSKFQVEESSGDYSRYRKLRLEENFSETFLPGDPFVVQLTARNEFAQQEYNVQIHKLNDIDAYIDIIQAHDLYERTFYGPTAIYTTDTNGLEEIMSYTGQLFKKDERWGALYAILPNSLAEGCYVVSIYDPKADSGKPAVQKLIQISNVSVYSQISNGEIPLPSP